MMSRVEDRFKPKENPAVVVGGGIIGLSIGWQLRRRGVPVTLFERDEPGRAASWVAAGMLAPHAEVGFEEEGFLRLALASLELYPRFLAELKEDSGKTIELDGRGTLIVGFNRDDSERIRRLYEFREQLALPVRWLTSREARDIEPMLSPKVMSAIWLPKDGQINNRAVLRALETAFVSRGGDLRKNTAVTSIRTSGDRAAGVRTSNGETVAASRIIVAAGCWSGQIEGIPDPLRRTPTSCQRVTGAWLSVPRRKKWDSTARRPQAPRFACWNAAGKRCRQFMILRLRRSKSDCGREAATTSPSLDTPDWRTCSMRRAISGTVSFSRQSRLTNSAI
jgi:glycine oxidase